jgi:hypothetical protein
LSRSATLGANRGQNPQNSRIAGVQKAFGAQLPAAIRRLLRWIWKGEPVATIRASCPTCGDVELTSADVRVLVCTTTNEGSYAFRCPDCRLAVAKPAEARVVDVLVSSGVCLSTWELPAELEEAHTGAPISYDDLLEFHFALQQEGWFDRLTASVGSDEPELA